MRLSFSTGTLKFRLTVVVICLVLVATSLVALVALTLAERKMRNVIGDQQFALLSSAAAYIDADLNSRKVLLSSLREQLASTMPLAGQMQDFLESHATLREEFFNVVVLDAAGNMVANLTDRRAVMTQKFNARPYFVDTVRLREGVISKPFRSILTRRPLVLVTEPVFDAQGALLYILGGSIDLQRPRFFGHLESLKFGKSGYLFMLAADGTVIHHPDRTRILANVKTEAGRAVPSTLAALDGFEGWTEGISRRGVPALLTYKRLRQTDWIIGAVYPVDEAFTPLIEMQRLALIGSAIVALVAGLAGWLLIMRLLRPLGALRNHVAKIHQGSNDIGVFDVERKDEFGELSRAFFKLSQQRRAAENELSGQARTDTLTGIANRRMFEEVFEIAIERAARMNTWIGLAYLDIDHFKAINDTHGHAAGDTVLVEFARRLQLAVRSIDTVARLAGDEFVVIFECVGDDASSGLLAEKILASVRPAFMLGERALSVTTSVGIAVGQGGVARMAAMLGAADEALYDAKHKGRNTYAVRRLSPAAMPA